MKGVGTPHGGQEQRQKLLHVKKNVLDHQVTPSTQSQLQMKYVFLVD